MSRKVKPMRFALSFCEKDMKERTTDVGSGLSSTDVPWKAKD